jgi:methionyl-tRNA synthetase
VWPADLHVIGKDIVRFHCVYWPAMLMSAGVPVPRGVWAHGWMTMGGGKISKSAGVSFTLEDAIARHGADALRYFVMREIPWDGDGSFTWERFDERYVSDLANDLGNLANRTLSMVHRYRGGTVPGGTETALDVHAAQAVAKYRERMDRYLLHEGVATAMSLVSQANAFVETKAPWKLAKDPAATGDLDDTLTSLVRTLAVAATLLFPFMPGRMSELWTALGGDGASLSIADIGSLETKGWTVAAGAVLFPRPEVT